jgi:hypothetical protein
MEENDEIKFVISRRHEKHTFKADLQDVDCSVQEARDILDLTTFGQDAYRQIFCYLQNREDKKRFLIQFINEV